MISALIGFLVLGGAAGAVYQFLLPYYRGHRFRKNVCRNSGLVHTLSEVWDKDGEVVVALFLFQFDDVAHGMDQIKNKYGKEIKWAKYSGAMSSGYIHLTQACPNLKEVISELQAAKGVLLLLRDKQNLSWPHWHLLHNTGRVANAK